MEFGLADTFGVVRRDLLRPTSYAQATEGLAAMEEVLAVDARRGELMAAEVLRGGFGFDAEGAEGEGEGEAEGEGEGEGEGGADADDDDDDDGEGEGEGEGDEELDDELADVERQLRELELEMEEGVEGGARNGRLEEVDVTVDNVRRVATREEVDDFDKPKP